MKLLELDEILTDDLTDPEFQREFVKAMYEEGGEAGLVQAMQEILAAEKRAGRPEATLQDSDISLAHASTKLHHLGLRLALASV